MGVLTSGLFTSNDPETNKRLEDCATGSPNEMASHFTIGSPGGTAVRKLQIALKLYKGAHPFERTKDGRQIGDFQVNGIYSQEFADAIGIFKEINDIKNYAGKIDKIVGVKTIRSLDREAAKSDVTPVFVPPGQDPPMMVQRIERRVFTKSATTNVGLTDNDGNFSFSDIQTVMTDIANRIQDPEALLGKEEMAQRRVITVEDGFAVNFVTQTTTRRLLSKSIFGGMVFTLIETTELVYKYGPPHQTVVYAATVIVRTEPTIGGLDSTEQKTNHIRRDVADKSIILTPPTP